jgi:hypothetical protein
MQKGSFEYQRKSGILETRCPNWLLNIFQHSLLLHCLPSISNWSLECSGVGHSAPALTVMCTHNSTFHVVTGLNHTLSLFQLASCLPSFSVYMFVYSLISFRRSFLLFLKFRSTKQISSETSQSWRRRATYSPGIAPWNWLRPSPSKFFTTCRVSISFGDLVARCDSGTFQFNVTRNDWSVALSS